MIEEITIDGMPFIAARNAAAIVGMSPDYLTRWCREGRVIAEREAQKAQWRAQLSQRRKEERALATS